ncbi:MAG: glutaredoxin family protein [Mariprofundus sp.]|nr:glutaredoxin family protein [Mariprofundus sp.]
MPTPHLQLLSRSNCCLCEDAKLVLAALAAQDLCSWETVNVDQDKTLLVRFGMHVPVLMMGDEELFRHRLVEGTLKSTLVELQT